MLTPVPGRATAVGSWPGTDVLEATRTIFGELGTPHVPHLPELPARGPGADMVGRGACFLVDLPVDLQPSGWRLVSHPGRDLGRAQSWLRQDLDVLAEVADGFSGPLKVQVAGPWTLSASLHLARLERAVVDAGAVRDIVTSLAEGVSRHVAEIRRLVPGAEVVVQVDEPSVPAVLGGALRTASGIGRLRAVEENVVVEGLRTVLQAARAAGAVASVVHCCAARPPVALLARSGADALSLDVSLLGQSGWESVAGAVEAGTVLWAGAVGTSAPGSPQEAAEAVTGPWRRLGLASSGLSAVVVTPTCGLGATAPALSRVALRTARDAASVVAEASQA